MHSTFGARLRAQREKKGASLPNISSQTKIKLSLLEALERDDLSSWPHGLFGRAYLRAYTQAIGLDSESLIPEFLERHPDPPDELSMADAAPPAGISSAFRSALSAIPGLLRRTEKTDVTPAAPESARNAPPPHLTALANLCTRVQQADTPRDLLPILETIAEVLDASGLVLWVWNSATAALMPWLTHGYPNHVVAQLPSVRRDDENAIAAAFRTADMCVVDQGMGPTGAIVVPLVGGRRCVGALALELRDGGERRPQVRAAAVIVAALLVRFVEVMPLAAAARLA